MTPALRKLNLTAHITSSVGWLGAVASFLALSIAGLTSTNRCFCTSSRRWPGRRDVPHRLRQEGSPKSGAWGSSSWGMLVAPCWCCLWSRLSGFTSRGAELPMADASSSRSGVKSWRGHKRSALPRFPFVTPNDRRCPSVGSQDLPCCCRCDRGGIRRPASRRRGPWEPRSLSLGPLRGGPPESRR